MTNNRTYNCVIITIIYKIQLDMQHENIDCLPKYFTIDSNYLSTRLYKSLYFLTSLSLFFTVTFFHDSSFGYVNILVNYTYTIKFASTHFLFLCTKKHITYMLRVMARGTISPGTLDLSLYLVKGKPLTALSAPQSTNSAFSCLFINRLICLMLNKIRQYLYRSFHGL